MDFVETIIIIACGFIVILFSGVWKPYRAGVSRRATGRRAKNPYKSMTYSGLRKLYWKNGKKGKTRKNISL